jgi:ABC-type antimicrobial peptide transport system permease subunit
LLLIAGQGVKVTLLGICIGVAAPLMFTKLLASMLYGVAPADPVALAVTSTVLMSVAMLACYIPARRATRVDPLVAFHSD